VHRPRPTNSPRGSRCKDRDVQEGGLRFGSQQMSEDREVSFHGADVGYGSEHRCRSIGDVHSGIHGRSRSVSQVPEGHVRQPLYQPTQARMPPLQELQSPSPSMWYSEWARQSARPHDQDWSEHGNSSHSALQRSSSPRIWSDDWQGRLMGRARTSGDHVGRTKGRLDRVYILGQYHISSSAARLIR
jgi:hypothetical protein